jgi:hypothetical protein
MATNYSPTIVTDGAVFVGDARASSTATAGSRLYDQAGVDSTDVKLLIHGNEGSGQSFTDSSLSNHTVTAVGNVTHSTTQSKFSGESIYFAGSDDCLTLSASSDWDFGTGDFTIDYWVRFDAFSQYQTFYDYGYTASDGILLQTTSGSGGALRVYIGGGSSANYLSDSSTPIIDTWYHYAVVRSSGTVTIYRDGVSVGSKTLAADIGTPAYLIPAIGAKAHTTPTQHELNGYMDEIRITKGVALWTQNFTPPARRDTLSISDGMMYNGTCLDFDGTDDQVNIPSSSVFDLTGSFTWSFWANATTTTHEGWLFGRGGYGEAGYWGIRIDSPSWELQIDWASIEGATGYWLTDATLDAGSWVHISVTFDGSAAKIYKNGALVDSLTTSDAPGSGSQPLTIGYRDGNSGPFNGDMADVRLYDAALSAANVKEIYDDSKVIIPSNISQTNLKGWWPLTEGAGTLCYDGSGKGNTGTITNGEGDEWLTGQTGCPQLVEGYNRPAVFDATDYVTAAGPAVTGDMSVSAWIYRFSQGAYAGVVGKMGAAGSGDGWFLRFDGSNNLEFMIQRSGSTTGEATASASINAWHHVVGTNDGTNLKVYVDGVLGSTVSSGGATTDSGTVLQMATYGWNVINEYSFIGIVNEVIVYDKALSLAEVQALGATDPNGGPLPPNPMALSDSANVVGYWRNDGNVTWTDRSSNSNDGTVGGSPDALLFKQGINGSASTSTGRDNQGFPLKYKDVGAIGFVNDSVDFGNVISFDNTDNFTVEAWFQADVASGMDSYQPIVSKEGSSEFGYGLKIDRAVAGGPWFYGIATGTTNRYQYAAALTNGEWYHGCVLFSSSTNYITVFINGEQSHGPYSDQGAFSGTTSTNSLKFGQTGSNFIGQIGSSKIYNRLLSHAEIKQNYNAQKSRFT